MSNEANLIAGRLGFPLDGGSSSANQNHPVRYGVSRLGLIARPGRARRVLRAAPAGDAPYKRGTYKLPKSLLARLRAYAEATGQYQYVIVTKALQKFLLESAARGDPRRDLPVIESRTQDRVRQSGSTRGRDDAPKDHRPRLVGDLPKTNPPDYDPPLRTVLGFTPLVGDLTDPPDVER